MYLQLRHKQTRGTGQFGPPPPLVDVSHIVCLLNYHVNNVCLDHADFTASKRKTISSLVFQKTADVVEELLVVLRNQQRELMELRGQIETMQSSILSQVERVLTNHQEQERILPLQSSSQGPTSTLLLECEGCGP